MNLIESLNAFLGIGHDSKELTFGQIAARGVIVFVVALVMVRLGDKRFLSKKTAFDAILGLILASMIARAVNGSAAFWPTLGGGFVLVALHRLIAFLSRRSHAFGNIVKGTSDLVIRDGKIIEAGMRKNDLSEHDLMEDLRVHGQVANVEDVKLAYAERNGHISVVPEKKG
ncbi:MAG TPA: YetF domain-containing protein [Candidatus Angelobacter sp.]|nr:YetF domain-containing protein [Candidatus Angelobacter sp.]